MNLIKVNLPDNAEAYISGNGEGVWVLVDAQVKKLYDDDVSGIIASGILDNDSWYYQGLKAGSEIQFELRGNNRPVVSLDWLQKNYGYADKQSALDYILGLRERKSASGKF